MLTPYDGTLGVMFDKNKLENELNKYLAKTDTSLSYEVKESRTKIVIITGKNDDEKEIILFQHPFIFNTIYHQQAIALDMRPYMKSKLDDMVTISEKLQDRYNGELQMQRLIFTKLMVDDDMDWLSYMNPQLQEAFSDIIATVTSMMLFDRTIVDNVKIAAKLHYVSMDDDESKNKLSEYITKLNRKDISELTHGSLKDLYGYLSLAFDRKELMLPSRSIGSLVNNIKIAIMSDRSKGLTSDLYVQTLSRGFFSLDSNNLSIAMIEHLPTFISIIINVMLEGINSKSTFRKILEANKRYIKGKELATELKKIYNNEINL